MKKKYLKYLLLVALFSILSLGNLENLCGIYSTLGFDNQILLLWKYTASIGMSPYRDIFYPYGLLSYYSAQNIIFAFIYFFITPILLLGIFLTLRKIFKDNLLSISSFVVFFLFLVTITGFEVFTRYGLITVLSILYAHIFYSNKNKSQKILFGLGVLSGALIVLVNDVGIYALLIFLMFSIFNQLILSSFRPQIIQLKHLLKDFIFFILGYAFGFLPFFLYLIYTQSLQGFISNFVSLGELVQFGKTPFFHSIFSVDNLFVLTLLMIAITRLTYKFLFTEKKSYFVTYVQISLILVLLILEQKSIIRSIDTQLTFIGLLIFYTLFYELQLFLRRCKLSKRIIFIYFVNLSIIILFIIGLRSNNKFLNQYLIPSPYRIISAIKVFQYKSCVDKNIKEINTKNKEFFKIKNDLYAIKGFNGRILTFPGEPIFYIFLKQKPPFYPTIYEATPIKAQEELIAYLKKEKVNVILYNVKTGSIQDGVPDVVRGRLLYKYILENFNVVKRVDNYLIFRNSKK